MTKDRNGERVVKGDILVGERGNMFSEGKKYTRFKIWEFTGKNDGEGIYYDPKGKRHRFSWAYAGSSIKLNPEKLPDGFLFAFTHGMSDIKRLDSIDTENTDVYDWIEKSDWKENALTPDIVKKYLAVEAIEIKCMADVAEKWDDIFCFDGLPSKTMYKILEAAGIESCQPINGELGIAMMEDELNFLSIFRHLREWKEQGILIEKCKDFDKKMKEENNA